MVSQIPSKSRRSKLFARTVVLRDELSAAVRIVDFSGFHEPGGPHTVVDMLHLFTQATPPSPRTARQKRATFAIDPKMGKIKGPQAPQEAGIGEDFESSPRHLAGGGPGKDLARLRLRGG
jgi:hypothetical protein